MSDSENPILKNAVESIQIGLEDYQCIEKIDVKFYHQ